MATDYLRQLISVLPPSKYDLRRNHVSGILLASLKVNVLLCRLQTLEPSSIYGAVYFQSKSV